jgi:outer membrane protein TolC
MLMGGLLLLSLVLGQADAAKATTDVSSKIRELQAERVKLLERGMELVSMAYAKGSRDFAAVFELQLELLDAKLDAAASKEEQIAVLNSQLKVANQTHEMARQRFENGSVSQLDVIQAKAVALRIEIELLKLKCALGNHADKQH